MHCFTEEEKEHPRNMGTNINFNNLGGDPSGGNQMKPSTGSVYPLARQSSVYSLTFDELQSTLGVSGKEFGSMNMDELLKSIWTAEETQAMTSLAAVAQPSGANATSGGNLQRQGSLTLPRTISQKTVDEVWKDLSKEINGNIGSSCGGEPSAPARQQTLGEMTLEEFLFRTGVVREENCTQQNNNGFYGNNGGGLAFGFGQPNQNSISFSGNNESMVLNQSPGLGLKVSGTQQQQPQKELQQQPQQQLLQQRRRQVLQQPQQQLLQQPRQQQLLQQPRQQLQEPQSQQYPQQRLPQTIFPKQANVAFASPANVVNKSFAGVANNSMSNSSGFANYGTGVTVAVTSPGTSSADNNSLSPVPYVFGRGRRSNAGMEKVVERRQRRMIKNRESAARSRARKQAYTLELEAEIEKLKKVNQELQRKQAELMESQKNELKESSKHPWGNKRQCLRRTLTGPW